jgi:hypothetical protein
MNSTHGLPWSERPDGVLYPERFKMQPPVQTVDCLLVIEVVPRVTSKGHDSLMAASRQENQACVLYVAVE